MVYNFQKSLFFLPISIKLNVQNTVKIDQAQGVHSKPTNLYGKYRILMLGNSGYTSVGIFKLP